MSGEREALTGGKTWNGNSYTGRRLEKQRNSSSADFLPWDLANVAIQPGLTNDPGAYIFLELVSKILQLFPSEVGGKQGKQSSS